MAIWIWPWRRTMLVKAQWTVRTAFRHFAKPATTCRKCRMLISGQARDAWKVCGPIHAPSARNPIPPAESFSPTSKTSQIFQSVRAEGALQSSGARKAGMLESQNFFHKLFASASPVFLAIGLTVFCALPSPASEDSGTHNDANRRQAASTQFARAEEMRAELNTKSIEKRPLSEYKQVVASYRRVYLITPHAAEVPDALLAVAELYSEMGDKFGRSYCALGPARRRTPLASPSTLRMWCSTPRRAFAIRTEFSLTCTQPGSRRSWRGRIFM